MPTPAPPPGPVADDPVRARRARIARWNRLATRLGWLCFLAAVVLFAVALAGEFSSAMSALIIGALVAGTVLLAPAIVVGYAVKAAERDDRERGV